MSPSRPERRIVRWLLAALVGLAVAGVFIGIRVIRDTGAAPTVDARPRASGMPSSSLIETTYGVRFDRVVVTAAHGMLQLDYTVVDQSKANAIHDAATAPFVQLSDGTKLDQPGIPGHGGHGKIPAVGAGGYILLANTNGAVGGGAEVSIRMGKLHLDHVIVEG